MHAMIDVETLGTGQDAVIAQIGAVAFNPFSDRVSDRPFVARVDVRKQPGRSVDADTALWWLRQSSAAQLSVFAGDTVSLASALAALDSWWWGQQPDCVWVNSPSFDCAILRHAYRSLDRTPPWSFRDERDQRTLVSLSGVQVGDLVVRETLDVEHDALRDAQYQARVVQAAYRSLGLWGSRDH